MLPRRVAVHRWIGMVQRGRAKEAEAGGTDEDQASAGKGVGRGGRGNGKGLRVWSRVWGGVRSENNGVACASAP